MNRNTSRIVMGIAAAAAVVLTTTGAASSPPSAPDTTSSVASAVHALVAESAEAGTRAIPADFASVMGYRPMVLDAMAGNPNGDCSSPVPLPSEFDSSCKAHDLGYDLIRYAAATGKTVDPHWRRAIDGQLESRLHAACIERTDAGSRRACDAAATVAAVAVDMNSWRQSFGAPVAEPGLPITLGGGAFALTVLSVLLTGRFLRRARVALPEIGELA